MRFVGQGSEIHVEIPGKDFSRLEKESVRKWFDHVYEKRYGRTYPDSPVELINFKVRASLPVRFLQFPKIRKDTEGASAAIKGKRMAYSSLAKDYVTHAVYDRYKLFAGAKLAGPAVIEEKESTVVVGEDALVTVDAYGFLWVEIT
jgi:N-methylhydantoinase A